MKDAAVISAKAVSQLSVNTRYQKEGRIILPVSKSNIIIEVSLMSKFILRAARESAFHFLLTGAFALALSGLLYYYI